MECPVCNTKDLSGDDIRCPKCNADLEALHATGKIKKDHRNRLSFAIIMSVLFLAVLLIWILTGVSESPASEAEEPATTDVEQLKSELAAEQSKVATLESENRELEKKLASLRQEEKERTKEYVVQNGESLFLIARKIYGNGFKYVDIAKANNIENPDLIRTGQKLTIHY